MTWAETGEVIRTVAPFVQLAVIVIGWRYISSDNNERESRKELRSLVNDWRRQIEDLRRRGVSYYVLGPDDPAAVTLARELKFGMHALAQQIQQYSTFCPDFDAEDQVVGLRQALTGGDFESRSRVAQSVESQTFDRILRADVQLVIQLEHLFMKIYSARTAK